jgi:hypothetical protein
MEFRYAYHGSSAVESRGDSTAMSFVPDARREPTYFSGELGQNVSFREAISALHDVVISDLRYQPKDKSAYKAWAAQRDEREVQQILASRKDTAEKIGKLHLEMAQLQRRFDERRGGFERAKKEYFSFLYKRDYNAWLILDPVITVHPDEISFECFSKDESTYGRLAAGYGVFKKIGQHACGTTNIDYSDALYQEFQKIRSYKTTRLDVDASGFDVKTEGQDDFREVKIDLPDSWVRGFLQVSSAMTLPAVSFSLHPVDMQNICHILRRHREHVGPRSLRYHLTPGQPIRLVFEPWGYEVLCRRSIFEGSQAQEIRTWGRRRLLVMERLLPVAQRFHVHLLGTGLPSFYVADLDDMSFTLGLSGWTTNDWSRAGNFDLLAPRMEVDEFTRRRVFDGLKKRWFARPDELASQLELPRSAVLGALGAYTQAGRAIYDINRGVYRARELSLEPLPLGKLRFSSEREEHASRIVAAGGVEQIKAQHTPERALRLEGRVKTQGNNAFTPSLLIDPDLRIVEARCSCNFFQQNKLFKGPCDHMIALRLAHSRRIFS